MSELEDALRASLNAHARHPDSGAELAEQIIAVADREPIPIARARRVRAWTFPVLAAGAAAAVAIALVVVGHPTHTATPPLQSNSPVPPASTPVPTQPVSSAAAPSSSATPSTAPAGLTNVRIVDLTFVGANDGWALASADCLTNPALTCTAMLRTTDGGTTWQSMPPPPVNDSGDCAAPCATHVRFATPDVGYAFGPSALFMTSDGGVTWNRQSGGATALESLDGNVIRVVTTPQECSPPGCTYAVETAPIGSTSWRSVSLGAYTGGMSAGAALARTGSAAYVMVFGHVAGGAQDARSTLYTSTDDGATWTNRGEPCPQGAGEVDSTAITTAADGSVTVACVGRTAGPTFTATSTDSGVTFHAAPASLGAAGVQYLGAASASVLFVDTDVLYRSADGGRTWQRVQQNSVGPLTASWIGFESTTVGRLVEQAAGPGSATSIWTTHDAGLTWSSVTFG